jgi:hypothetical protein
MGRPGAVPGRGSGGRSHRDLGARLQLVGTVDDDVLPHLNPALTPVVTTLTSAVLSGLTTYT